MSQYAKLITELLYEVRSDGDVIAGPTGLERRAARAISALERELDEAREALGPFAAVAARIEVERPGWNWPGFEVVNLGMYYDDKITMALAPFQRARTALASKP